MPYARKLRAKRAGFHHGKAGRPKQNQSGWLHGDLSYKYHAGQKAANEAFEASPERWFMMDVSRRWGKSYWSLCKAIEACRRKKNARVAYIAPTRDMVRSILMPLMTEISADCPEQLRPTFKTQTSSWHFPETDSTMVVVGADTQADRARGTHLDFAVLDEAAFYKDLQYLVRSIVIPQFQGRGEDAKMLLISTPPLTPAHPWTSYWLPIAQGRGNYFRATIEDNPRLKKQEIEEFIAMAGGRDSTDCRREYFAEHIVDESLSVLPEFARHKEDIVVPEEKWPERPDFFDAYVATDPGSVDLWATVFAYWNFAEQVLYVEDELTIERSTTRAFVDQLLAKEKALWLGKDPYLRVSDVDPRLVADLLSQHAVYIQPSLKQDKMANLARLRFWLQAGKIKIHPRCRALILHLGNAIWKQDEVGNATTKYARIADFGHFDYVDAMCYLVRNISEMHNPYPKGYGLPSSLTHFITSDFEQKKQETDASGQTIARAFGGRRFLRRS